MYFIVGIAIGIVLVVLLDRFQESSPQIISMIGYLAVGSAVVKRVPSTFGWILIGGVLHLGWMVGDRYLERRRRNHA